MAISPSSLLAEFKLHTEDPETDDELWNDTELLAYLNEAQDEFCTRTLVMVDSTTPALTQYSVSASQIFVPYDSDLILKFLDQGVDTTNGKRIHIMSYQQLEERYAHPSYWTTDYGQYRPGSADRSDYVWQTDTGQTKLLISDLETGSLRCYPIPTVAFDFTCTVNRMPLTDISDPLSVLETDFAIQRKYRRMLLNFMEWKAYSKEDAETYDAGLAEKALIKWENNISKVLVAIEREKSVGVRVTRYREH